MIYIYMHVRLIFLLRSGCGGLVASTVIWCSRRLQSFQAGWSNIWITHFNKNKGSCLTFGGVEGRGGGFHLGCCLWKETGGAARAGEPILLINICHCSIKVNELMPLHPFVVPHWSLFLSQAPSVTVRFLWSGCQTLRRASRTPDSFGYSLKWRYFFFHPGFKLFFLMPPPFPTATHEKPLKLMHVWIDWRAPPWRYWCA